MIFIFFFVIRLEIELCHRLSHLQNWRQYFASDNSFLSETSLSKGIVHKGIKWAECVVHKGIYWEILFLVLWNLLRADFIFNFIRTIWVSYLKKLNAAQQCTNTIYQFLVPTYIITLDWYYILEDIIPHLCFSPYLILIIICTIFCSRTLKFLKL